MMTSSSSSRNQSTFSEIDILLNFEETNCGFCYTALKLGQGILLQECLHPFCRTCITTWIENADTEQINCPLDCGSKILEREIKTLVPQNVFDSIQKRSFEKAIRDTPNAFKCKTPNCSGICFVESDSKVYHCEICRKFNCIGCEDIHEGFTCEEYKAEIQKCITSGIRSPKTHVQKLIQDKNQTNGFGQFLSSNLTSNSTNNDSNEGSSADINFMMDMMDQNHVLNSRKEFTCPICCTDIPVGDGIILQDCYDTYCKSCIISHIQYCTDVVVSCPTVGCSGHVTPREIQALVPSDILEKITQRNWTLAESIIPNKFHCLTPNCNGFCELVGNVNAFLCDLCRKSNCIPCNTIHEKMTCADYKNRIQQNENDDLSDKALENLVSTGRAMRCVCKAIVQKEQGCDAIICIMCKTHLCYATKMPRWGKNGVNDISGGCRCKVDGKLCHPNCKNCH